MKLKSVFFALSLFGTAFAFAPPHISAGTQRACLTELEMANGAKRKAALKVTKKFAGTTVGIVLATASIPAAAHAAHAAVESAKGAKDILSVGAGAFAAGIATSRLLKKLGAENIEEVSPSDKSK